MITAACGQHSKLESKTLARLAELGIDLGTVTEKLSFLRHEEIYRSDARFSQSWERQLVSSLPVLIGCDEFPVGYSLAGCPPAEPASASPTAKRFSTTNAAVQ